MSEKRQAIDPKLFSERLKKARKIMKMTGKDLAELAGLSPQTISRYENADSIPNFTNLCMISEVTKLPIDFFIQEVDDSLNVKHGTIYFRKVNKASSLSIKMGEEIIDVIKSYYMFFSQYIIFPKLNIKRESLDPEKKYSHYEIEEIASQQRKMWDIEDGPINNLTWNFEKNGILVSRVELDDDYLDGQSTWINNERPLVLLSADKKCSVRSRFDLAHELAHIVLHSYYEDLYDSQILKKMEKEAFIFASAFLMPEKEFFDSVFSTSINDFIMLKRQWKVSIAAIVQRCYDLNIITDARFTSLQKQISYNRWRKEEPLDKDIPIEQPKLFNTVVENLLSKNIISKKDILNVLKLPRGMVEKLLTLDPDILKEEESYNNVIELRDYQQE